MFKNLKQKTLNDSTASVISSRSISSSSLVEDENRSPEPNVSVLSTRYQSVESLSSVNEDQPSTPRAVFGNLEGIIDDLKNQIKKKDNENKKLQFMTKDSEKQINELATNWNKDVEAKKALERAYEKLEDTNEVNTRQLRDKLDAEKTFACKQLQNQIDKLKRDNEKLNKKNNSADAVAWQNKAESVEKAYQELVEIQEHSEIQVQKMKDLIVMKDNDLQALQKKFDETADQFDNIQTQLNTNSSPDESTEAISRIDFDTLNWEVAKSRQEIESLENQVIKLELDLDNYKQKASDKDYRIGRLREDIKNKDIALEAHKCDAVELTNSLEKTSNLLSDAKAESESSKVCYEKNTNDLQEEVKIIKERYEETTLECQKQADLIEQLQIAASATKTIKSNLESELELWKNKYEESESNCAQLLEYGVNNKSVIDDLKLHIENNAGMNSQVESLKEDISALQQNELELKQENEYLVVARESWIEEKRELEAQFNGEMGVLSKKNSLLKEELELLRRSNQATILPVSSSLQAKFVKGVTEVDIATRKEVEEELADFRQKCSDLETELSGKTKQLKQTQQHLSDMKKTLQSELRGGPNISPCTSSRASPALPRKQSEIVSYSVEVNKSITEKPLDDVNQEYLKHCVIKYMTSFLDSETNYLVRVISVLLNFTQEENDIVHDALDYKASWFRQMPPKSLKKLKSTRESYNKT